MPAKNVVFFSVCSSTSVVMLLLLLSLSCTLCSAQLGPLALLMENNAQINSNRRQHHPGCNLRTHYLDSKHFTTFCKQIVVLNIKYTIKLLIQLKGIFPWRQICLVQILHIFEFGPASQLSRIQKCAESAYCIVASTNTCYYSENQLFVKRSQYIRTKNPLHKQSEKAKACH